VPTAPKSGSPVYGASSTPVPCPRLSAGVPHCRPDTVKAELRRTLYDLFDQALRSAGIHRRHRDRFTDRGDGLLALIHPVDQASKPVVLNRAIPALGRLLAGHSASLASTGRQHGQLRVRVVVHAGEIHYDNNGCFGEALGIAFRAFHPLINVHLAGHCYPGWIRASRQTAQLNITEIASYKQKVQYKSRGRTTLIKTDAFSPANSDPE
jgi:hypothetical protein